MKCYRKIKLSKLEWSLQMLKLLEYYILFPKVKILIKILFSEVIPELIRLSASMATLIQKICCIKRDLKQCSKCKILKTSLFFCHSCLFWQVSSNNWRVVIKYLLVSGKIPAMANVQTVVVYIHVHQLWAECPKFCLRCLIMVQNDETLFVCICFWYIDPKLLPIVYCLVLVQN